MFEEFGKAKIEVCNRQEAFSGKFFRPYHSCLVPIAMQGSQEVKGVSFLLFDYKHHSAPGQKPLAELQSPDCFVCPAGNYLLCCVADYSSEIVSIPYASNSTIKKVEFDLFSRQRKQEKEAAEKAKQKPYEDYAKKYGEKL